MNAHRTLSLLGITAGSLLAAGPAQGAEPTPLSEIRVGASRDARSYAGEQRNTAASRTDTPLIEVPQNVRIVPQKLVGDLGATRLADVVGFVSGMSQGNDYGGTWDSFALRGFEASPGSLINGFSSTCQCGPRRDADTIERVEILKGPSAALYGSSEPGGTYNIVTKKPQFRPMREAGLKVGNRGLRRATFDATGPFSSTLAWRLNLVAEKGATRTSLIETSKYIVAPSLTWAPTARTIVNYEADITRIRTPYDRGLPVIDGRTDALPRDRYLGEPSIPNLHIRGDVHQLTLNHALNDQWSVRAGLMHRKADNTGHGTEPGALQRDGRTLTRRMAWRSMPSSNTSLQAEATGKLQTGTLRHTVLTGVEVSRYTHHADIRGSDLRTAPFGIDVYAPVYGQAQPPYTGALVVSNNHDNTRALYAQDQLDVTEQLKLMAGLRVERFHQRADSVRGNRTTRSNHHYSELTPRAGVTWMFSPESAAFLSWGRSFKPNAGSDVDGNAFEPLKGTAWELGYKWEGRQDAGQPGVVASISAFHITKNNVLTQDPVNTDFNIAAGQVRSRGVEADLAGDITPHWRLTTNAALTDTKVTRDNTANLLGKRLPNVPRVSAGLFALWHDRLDNGSEYGAGGGLVHVGERTGNATDTYRLPAYTSVKLSGYWQASERLRLTLAVDNLFDRTFYTASLATISLQLDVGRLVTVGVQYRF